MVIDGKVVLAEVEQTPVGSSRSRTRDGSDTAWEVRWCHCPGEPATTWS